jgi:hypothetical protein
MLKIFSRSYCTHAACALFDREKCSLMIITVIFVNFLFLLNILIMYFHCSLLLIVVFDLFFFTFSRVQKESAVFVSLSISTPRVIARAKSNAQLSS